MFLSIQLILLYWAIHLSQQCNNHKKLIEMILFFVYIMTKIPDENIFGEIRIIRLFFKLHYSQISREAFLLLITERSFSIIRVGPSLCTCPLGIAFFVNFGMLKLLYRFFILYDHWSSDLLSFAFMDIVILVYILLGKYILFAYNAP